MNIIDNVLDVYSYNQVIKCLDDVELTWQRSEVLPQETFNEHVKHNLQFVHKIFYEHHIFSPRAFKEILAPIADKIEIRSLIKAKLNLKLRAESIIEHGMHTDHDFGSDATTGIYYFNTNDGYTKFEDDTIVESVANRLVLFSSDMKHTGTTCTDTQGRYVLNINFF